VTGSRKAGFVDRHEIFTLVRQHTATVLDIDPGSIAIEQRLADLGANSIDRMEIVTMSLDALSLEVPLVEMAGVHNIESLVDLLSRKLSAAADAPGASKGLRG
jgi:polyketide biosynthesis acyl carrier protein